MKKRSVTVAGHATSVSVEEPFWEELRAIAKRDGLSLAGLIERLHDLDGIGVEAEHDESVDAIAGRLGDERRDVGR